MRYLLMLAVVAMVGCGPKTYHNPDVPLGRYAAEFDRAVGYCDMVSLGRQPAMIPGGTSGFAHGFNLASAGGGSRQQIFDACMRSIGWTEKN